MLQLKIIKGPAGQGQTFPLLPGRSLTVGRSEACEVRLPSAGISKTHCKLTAVSGSRAEIEDLGSSNGTFVNGLLIKKHAIKPGDTVTLNDFVLSVGIEAPRINGGAPPPGVGGFDVNSAGATPGSSAPPAAELNFVEKISKWVDGNIYPWADDLAVRFDVRSLVVGFFLIWSALIILATASPFADQANERVRSESVQVAKLYARQLVRLNQQAIIDQRYRELITDLDSRRGQTPGIIDAMILDVSKAQILAPVELIGRGLPNKYAGVAITKDEENIEYGGDGTAYVSAPIKIGASDGTNKTVATSFVTYNALSAEFSLANLIDRIVTSLLYALILSILVFIVLQRWIEGSLTTVAARIDDAMRNSSTTVETPVKWPALARICEVASTALTRAATGNGTAPISQENDWAVSCANACPVPAAAFDPGLTVIAWNTAMERLIGIRSNIAIGSDISGASRDVAFESAVRDLSATTTAALWSSSDRKIDFSGRTYKITMLSGTGAFFVTIHTAEE